LAKAEKKTQIMKAAEKLFASGRFHEITMDEIALAGKVGKGTIYRYFRDKDDLFFQVATSGYEQLHEVITRTSREDGDVREQLLKACKRIKRFFESRWRIFRMMQAQEARMPTCRKDFHQRMKHGRDMIHDAVGQILLAGVKAGQIRSDIPVKILAVMLLGMLRMHAHALADYSGKGKSLSTLMDIFLTGATGNGKRKSR